MNQALLDAAQCYAAMGWAVIPIRHRPGTSGKQPALRKWRQYQTRRPTEQELHEFFRPLDLDGLAVICGPVSGDLMCRDFDQADVYHRWAETHASLAKRLPTARTGRGYHVYFRGALPRIIKQADGELRGAGYVLLPPSRHPSGPAYNWLHDPRSTGQAEIIDVDPACFLMTERDGSHSLSSLPSLSSLSSLSEQQRRAVLLTLPNGVGQRNSKLFELARTLKAIGPLASAPLEDLRELVRNWHDLALPVIGTKPFETTWLDFAHGWERVRFPKGEEPMAEVISRMTQSQTPKWARGRYDSELTLRLILLCRELQRTAGDGQFYLSCRTAARVLGSDHDTCARRLRVLVVDRVIELVESGTKSRAARYKYIAEDAPVVGKSVPNDDDGRSPE